MKNRFKGLFFDHGTLCAYSLIMGTLSRFIWVVLPVVLVVGTAIVVPMKLFDDQGFDRVERLRLDLKKLEEANRQIKRQNNALRKQITAFHSDPEYIEKVARDELGLITPDEVIYQFPDSLH